MKKKINPKWSEPGAGPTCTIPQAGGYSEIKVGPKPQGKRKPWRRHFPKPVPSLFWMMWVETKTGKKREWANGGIKGDSVHKYPYAFSRFPTEVITNGYVRRKKDGGYGGKDQLFSSGSTYSPDLVLALATKWLPNKRGGRIHKEPYSLSQAICIASKACEGCMNVLAHTYGLPWGYKFGSKQHRAANTRCELCTTK